MKQNLSPGLALYSAPGIQVCQAKVVIGIGILEHGEQEIQSDTGGMETIIRQTTFLLLPESPNPISQTLLHACCIRKVAGAVSLVAHFQAATIEVPWLMVSTSGTLTVLPSLSSSRLRTIGLAGTCIYCLHLQLSQITFRPPTPSWAGLGFRA